MSPNIHWNAVTRFNYISLYQTDSNNNDIGILNVLASIPEIKMESRSKRHFNIEWPKNNPEIGEKIIAQLRKAGILIHEAHSFKLSTGIWVLESEAKIPLTEELFNLLLANEEKAEEIARAIWILGNDVPRSKEVLDLLAASKHPCQMSCILKALHQTQFPLKKGDFQYLLAKSAYAWELRVGFNYLIGNNIELTRNLFSFLLYTGKNAIQISRAICILEQANIPLTLEIRHLLEENGQGAEILSLVIEKLDHADIPLTEEICTFLANASKEYVTMTTLARTDFYKTDISLDTIHPLFGAAGRAQVDALFATIATFHLANGAPIPAGMAQFLANQSIHSIVPILIQLYDAAVPISEGIYKLLTLDAGLISTGLLDLRAAGIPLTEELLQMCAAVNCARFSAIGKILIHMQQSKMPLSLEMIGYLTQTSYLGLGWVIRQLHQANIPLSPEIGELFSKTYATRIYTVGKGIVDNKLALIPNTREEIMKTIACFSLLTLDALRRLRGAGIPLTPEIVSYLIAANELQSLALIWKSQSLEQEGSFPVLDALMELITTSDYLHYQMPGRTLVHLHQAGIPLTQNTLDAIRIEKETHFLAIQNIILLLAKDGILTKETFGDLVAGYGSRVPMIWKKLGELPFNWETWKRILSEVREAEWKPCREAAMVFGQRNRVLERESLVGRLPPEMIGKIASYLAPPGMAPYYEVAATEVAAIEEARFLTCDLVTALPNSDSETGIG